MRKQLYSVVLAGLVGGLAAAPPADAQTPALTATTVNMFAGPSGMYPVVAQVPGGVSITVFGCLSDFSWCDVGMPGLRGWVWGDFITYPFMGRPVPLMTYGARIGIPVVTFSLGTYWGMWYRDRPWFRNQAQWAGRPRRPGPPPAVRPPHRPPAGRPPAGRPPVRPPAGRPPGGPGSNARPPNRPGGPGGAVHLPGNTGGRPQNQGAGGPNRGPRGGEGGGGGQRPQRGPGGGGGGNQRPQRGPGGGGN